MAASSRDRATMLGNGKGGVSAGIIAPARWVSVQIGQKSSARFSCPVGVEGALASLADDCALATVAALETEATWSRCTWANETASWNASANSARYGPNLERDRNQPIVVTLRVSDSRQNQRLANDIRYNGDITAIRLVDI
jgi:hypothetical protein